MGSEPTERTLCEITGATAARGACPIHAGDACLRQYVPREEADALARLADAYMVVVGLVAKLLQEDTWAYENSEGEWFLRSWPDGAMIQTFEPLTPAEAAAIRSIQEKGAPSDGS